MKYLRKPELKETLGPVLMPIKLVLCFLVMTIFVVLFLFIQVPTLGTVNIKLMEDDFLEWWWQL